MVVGMLSCSFVVSLNFVSYANLIAGLARHAK
jgi:hypothetical protein